MIKQYGRAVICALLLLLVLPGLVFADRVIPSSRVESHLNVRAQPSVDSQVVSQLQPNESAEFVASVPYWYEVRLDNGEGGFVSKAWSQRVEEATETGEIIRLGAWNIKKLGHGDSKDFPLVASIIEANFDVLAVVEIMQKSSAHPGYETLMSALGNSWSGLITSTPRPNTGAGHAEFYAVIYRNALVRPCDGWTELVYHADNDGSGSSSDPDVFSREPAFGCFEVPLNMTTPGLDFMLAPYHAISQNHGVTAVKNEVGALNAVFNSMSTAQPGERDLWIMGDFNLTPNQLDDVFASADRTVTTGATTLNSSGGLSANLFDHLLVHDEAASSELIGDAEILDVRSEAANDQMFFERVSDHLPIRIQIRSSGPDDD